MNLDIESAYQFLKPVVNRTPIQFHSRLSEIYGAKVYLKREDLQVVRSYKIRGAYYLIQSLSLEERRNGIVCASAGNHAQGVAYSCKVLNLHGVIYMPAITPKQKINQVKMFGDKCVEIVLVGDTFDDCQTFALDYAKTHNMVFVPPFDHIKIMEGQGTVAKEILEEESNIDYVFVPIGGGGLCAGVGSYFKEKSPNTKIIGVEPFGAPSMKEALKQGKPVALEKIDKFVDGAAVKKVGDLTFPICKEVLSDMLLVKEGKVCSTLLNLYNEDAIVAEPAGALSISALDQYADQIRGKKVVCILSGGNNDIDRMQEIKERSLLYEGLKHYFIVRFAQRPGALKQFVNEILGPNDDIVRFEFIQKNNKESGPALIGIELKSRDDFQSLLERMDAFHLNFTLVNQDENLFEYLI
ncbi:threonine ammonia-lyase IlvA [Leptospira sp. 2 VSF19]|uniref:L-threonine dehydratase n=1 Tax=Leptospira soteropolitanensis TaxID=2950025 RepID=A0AAW5VHQ5_9LEPT|nr:threonine ammonia-lyase IlvA [Leptospira soteropolitanensis]MCW7492293.1 threonine ammonia-lyase IlvA [Leptospira soteropolitanensis]MCW7499875.1 threonine ammonia-lyase IlvA [Leptospira soteropolitanensis]MCW7522126.1 threonine ammonia-lyase IlvA [Leptospira soteropolitanensis]MCW7525980.1 threonine ammonia-lyase IlvA [Leptospira soteropolitanensis]MCW7529906.1 threonine ammonia-lyase IlvA [Leptospira soteropolitanensis]